ncbi:MAG TPA: hypothetical protein PLU80_03525 [Acidobacteriota bacterium]|nr:hypothetical protein [Acidobacteriota bacterium]
MKSLNIILALANRQLLENRPIFALALVGGLATLALPFVIGTPPKAADHREFLENIRAGAQVLGMVVSYGVAFYLGISLFGRELSEKRMGFFFSRPISTNALWIGKLLGAWLLIASSLLLVCLPAILMDANPFLLREKMSWPVVMSLVGALPFLFCLGLTASIAFRSKSWWLTVDLVSLAITVLLVLFGVDRLEREVAILPLIFGGLLFFAVTTTGMLVASRISLGQGRTNLRSVHRVMSLCLWSIVFLGVGLFDGYTRWVINVTPDDFTQLRNVSPISNGWFLIDGQAQYRPDYFPTLLHNPLTGQFVRVGDLDTEYSFPSVSPDGHYAAWVHISRHRKPEDSGGLYSGNLVVCRLEGTIPKPQTTSLVYPSNTHFEFSPDGAFVAAITPDRVELISIQSHRIINQFSIPGKLQKDGEMFLRKAVFPSPEILRLYRSAYRSDPCQIVEINLKMKTIAETGWIEISFFDHPSYNQATDQLVVYSNTESYPVMACWIFDGRTGKRLFSLPTTNGFSKTFVLSDGRYLQAIPTYQTVVTHKVIHGQVTYILKVQFNLFPADGKKHSSFELALEVKETKSNSFFFCAETKLGEVLCLVNNESGKSQLYKIDCDTGQVTPRMSFEFTSSPVSTSQDEYITISAAACMLRKEWPRDDVEVPYYHIDPTTWNRRQLYATNFSRSFYY